MWNEIVHFLIFDTLIVIAWYIYSFKCYKKINIDYLRKILHIAVILNIMSCISNIIITFYK